MDRESRERLRFDRRLENRAGWVGDEVRTANLEALPDVSEKMTRGLDEPEEAEEEAVAPAVPETPVSTGFPSPGGTPEPFGSGGSELS